MEKPDARIYDDPDGWANNNVRLFVRDGDAYLMEDGTWHVFEEGARIDRAGIVLPRAVIEPIAIAIADWQGHVSHADTEARVLREWLAVERERVDRAIHSTD